MQNYRSIYPTLRQAKTKWSKPSIVQKQGEGPSHGWLEMLKRDAKAKLAQSIIHSKMGTMHKQEKIFREDKVTVFHHDTQIQNMRTKETGIKKRKNRMNKDPRPTDFSRPSLKIHENFNAMLESKIEDKIRSHPAVEYYGGKNDDHFINLKKGWHMGDGQRSFGSDNAQQALKTLKQVRQFKPGEAKEYGLEEAKDQIGKPSPSVEEIAKKHGITVDQVNAQIRKGIEVEKEHTNNESEAAEIARDHLGEFPDYYDRLGRMEKTAKKQEGVKEDAGIAAQALGSFAAATAVGAAFGPAVDAIKAKLRQKGILKAKKKTKEVKEEKKFRSYKEYSKTMYPKQELPPKEQPPVALKGYERVKDGKFNVLRKKIREAINEATLIGSGPDAKRHAEKYITPYIGQKDTHTIKKDVEHIPAGSRVSVHGHKVIDGKHHAVISAGRSTKKVNAPFTHINKPVTAKNKGLDYESKFVSTLNKHGLMKGKGAGSTSGNDFHLIDKHTGKVHKGTVAEHAYQGESKKDLSAAYGQASLSHHPKKGWHFSDKAKERFPHYTAAIEKATVTVGKTKVPLLKHVNKEFGAPDREHKSSHNVYSDTTDLHPAHAYMKDHHVDVLHVGSHGTYRAGLSHHKDRTPLGLPRTEGEGRYRVRQKHRNSLTVQFNIKKLEKSSVHLDNPEHLNAIKQKLGHTITEHYDPEVEIIRNRIEAHKNLANKMKQAHGEHSPEASFHSAYVRHMQKQLKDQYGLDEDAVVANCVGGGMSPTVGGEGNIKGFDPILGKTTRRKRFAGKQVFVVDPTTYHKAYLGKKKYEHYEKYLEGCDIADEIRAYGRKYWDEPIIIENEQTGAMVYLKYGSK